MAKPKAQGQLDPARLPRHVAIIMDGNGRWAQRRGLPRVAGHKAAMESVRAAVKACSALGIGYLTLYTFSTENWRRPRSEVGFLMRLLQTYLRREIDELDANNVRVQAMGGLDALPAAAQELLAHARSRTEGNTGLTLTLALNYGGRQELVAAARRAMELARKGRLKPAALDEATFGNLLLTSGMPDPDLVIRTSGEMRLSNFLLWQSAYAEFHVTPVFWPDFRRPHLEAALLEYQSRERRFGDVKAKA